MVALSPRPNETVNATTLANCNPSPSAHSTVPDNTTGKMPGRMLENITTTERNARPMKTATKANSMVRPEIELLDHAGAVARRDRGQPRHRNRVARVLRPDRVHRLVEILHHRQDLAGILVRHACRDHHCILLFRRRNAA